jgi:hypothetical protein
MLPPRFAVPRPKERPGDNSAQKTGAVAERIFDMDKLIPKDACVIR